MIRRKIPWTRQPPQGAKPELGRFKILAAGTGSGTDIVSGKPLVFGALTSRQVKQSGPAIKTNRGTTYPSGGSIQTATRIVSISSYTLVWHGSVSEIASGDVPMLLCHDDVGAYDDGVRRFQLRMEFGYPNCVARLIVFTSIGNDQFTVLVPLENKERLTVVATVASDIVALYVGYGNTVGSTSGPITSPVALGGKMLIGAFYGLADTIYSGAGTSAWGAISGAIDKESAISLTRNPWQLFAPQIQNIPTYVTAGGAFSPWWAARKSRTIGSGII